MQDLDVHLRQTRAFIDFNPADLVFTRRAFADDGAGGRRAVAGSVLGPQRARVVGTSGNGRRTTDDGQIKEMTVTVVGLPELDVEVGDTFGWDSKTFEVTDVSRAPAWATRAGATLRG